MGPYITRRFPDSAKLALGQLCATGLQQRQAFSTTESVFAGSQVCLIAIHLANQIISLYYQRGN